MAMTGRAPQQAAHLSPRNTPRGTSSYDTPQSVCLTHTLTIAQEPTMDKTPPVSHLTQASGMAADALLLPTA